MHAHPIAAAAVMAALPVLAACGAASTGPASPSSARAAPPGYPRGGVDPRDFVRRVDNPWFPLRPGTVQRWRGTQEGRRTTDVFTVTHQVRKILGVTTTVVHDRVSIEGRLRETTVDWYAQDRHGTVWYFGEATKSLDTHGHVTSTGGSWEAGVGGAQAGIFMPAHPRAGQRFRQEYLEGEAEDHFTIRSLHASVRVPYVTTRNAMRTTETSPLEPGVVDEKLYVRGVGTVLEATVAGPGHERLELVSVRRG